MPNFVLKCENFHNDVIDGSAIDTKYILEGGGGKLLDFMPSRLAKTASPKVNFQQKAIKNRVHISIFSNHKID